MECFDAVMPSLEVVQAQALVAIAYLFQGKANNNRYMGTPQEV